MPTLSSAPETTVFRVRPSFLPFLAMIVGIFALGIIIVIFILKLPIIFDIVVFTVITFVSLIITASWATTFYGLTNLRLEFRIGIIASSADFIETNNVSSVELRQSLLAKIFNFGDIIIVGDNTSSGFVFKHIVNPTDRIAQIKSQTDNRGE